jgi:hypothetical protein
MAEFSKQYCQLNDMGFDGDFDVYEEWSKLKPGYSVAYICEGFGFESIGKKELGDQVLVYVRNWEDDSKSKWMDFDEMCLKAEFKS